MVATTWSAGWFLPFVVPICIWVAWSDLARMKIPNISVLALFGVFAVLGLIALPFDEYLSRWLTALIVFGIGFALYAIGGIGAGDVKFAAAMAPYFAGGDLAIILYLFAGALFGALITHKLAARIPAIRRATPDWVSWTNPRFPMGTALTTFLLMYLVAAFFIGS